MRTNAGKCASLSLVVLVYTSISLNMETNSPKTKLDLPLVLCSGVAFLMSTNLPSFKLVNHLKGRLTLVLVFLKIMTNVLKTFLSCVYHSSLHRDRPLRLENEYTSSHEIIILINLGIT